MDVNEFLDKPISDVKDLEELPSGRYSFVISGYRFGEWGTGTPRVTFTLKASSVVDQDEVEDADLGEYRPIFYDLPLTENAQGFVKSVVNGAWGIPEDRSFREAFEEAVGLEVAADVKKQRRGKNDEIVRTEVDRFVPAE